MGFSEWNELELPAAFDAHVHLRDGEMARLVAPTVRAGGVDTVYVMPNLVPPITTVKQCLEYKERLQKIEPDVEYHMSLYLHESMTPELIREAKKAGIMGVKSYPAGVTTNSTSGVVNYETFYPIFAEMEAQNMILNLHGEVPSTPPHAPIFTSTSTSASQQKQEAITILNAEPAFLPTLQTLHKRFPKLRIILEHCSTGAAVAAVRACNTDVVRGTLTAHHLSLTLDDWAGEPMHYCKPVAKTPEDRDALLRAVVESGGRFFLGSDSAPHAVEKKRGGPGAERVAAGVFTQCHVVGYVLDALGRGVERGVVREDEVTKEVLEGFLSGWGRAFYGVPERGARVLVRRGAEKVVQVLRRDGVDVDIVPFRRGEETWSVEWK